MLALTQMDSWKKLEQQAQIFSFLEKTKYPMLSSGDIVIDYNAQCIHANTHSLLLQLADDCHLQQKIDDLFSGSFVNNSEQRPALHWALRANPNTDILINNECISEKIHHSLNQMRDISEQLRSHRWYGYTGKPITDIVNLGIGGSHLGPFFCLQALSDLKHPDFNYHFISDFDPLAFARTTKTLNPETTLFIVSSKSFTTAETLYNLKQAISWFGSSYSLKQHFIAVTAAPQKAHAYGIEHIVAIWEWIGGRFSVCSAINLITCIAIGFDGFSEFLKGAAEMDEHFHHTPFDKNMPVMLALLGIWTNNFLNIHQHLILTFGQQLDNFTSYIQQLDMESNGKAIDQLGRPVNYATAPIIWGGSGNQAQHSYYQLLSQGTHSIAADFISVDSYERSLIHQLCLAQKDVLSHGAYQHELGFIREHAAINHLRLKNVSPKSIGALIALYEHKIYAQSVIWQINPFDQPGVESSKHIMRREVANV